MKYLAQVESLNHEGQGVAHVQGKTVFIDGALPYEIVQYKVYRTKPNFDKATTIQLIKESFSRTSARCASFGICGGCSMQHVESQAQVAIKQRILEDNLKHIGRTRPELILAPLNGPDWHYRHRARLAVRYVQKKETVLIGFHEKNSFFIADMQSCDILPPKVSALLLPLRKMIERLTIYQQLPQIEVAVGEDIIVLVLRVMEALSVEDETVLREFADTYQIQFWLQPKGPETAYPFYPLDVPVLAYHLPEFSITMPFHPTEFTQVNPGVNQTMVKRAIDLLDPQPQERIIDMFCGIGNFTLPIARRGATTLGIEGSKRAVARAIENAAYNRLSHLATFQVANLFEMTSQSLSTLGHIDKMLIDPPRDGAYELVKSINVSGPRRIVYISCNPATLARDANVLVNEKQYKLKACGIINMFPHTSHVESIAVFER